MLGTSLFSLLVVCFTFFFPIVPRFSPRSVPSACMNVAYPSRFARLEVHSKPVHSCSRHSHPSSCQTTTRRHQTKTEEAWSSMVIAKVASVETTDDKLALDKHWQPPKLGQFGFIPCAFYSTSSFFFFFFFPCDLHFYFCFLTVYSIFRILIATCTIGKFYTAMVALTMFPFLVLPHPRDNSKTRARHGMGHGLAAQIWQAINMTCQTLV